MSDPDVANPYFELMQGEEDQRQQALAGAHATAFDTNPDQVAARQAAARYLGYPAAVGDALPDETQREAQLAKINTDSAPHPVLQKMFSDEDFMALARDDSSTLAAISKHITDGVKYIFSAPGSKGGFASDLAGGAYFGGGQSAAGVFQAAAELGASALEGLYPAIGEYERAGVGGGNPLRRLAEGFAAIGRDSGARLKALSPSDPSIVGGGVSSGVQSLGQNLMALPMALVNPSAGLTMMATSQGGHAYVQERT